MLQYFAKLRRPAEEDRHSSFPLLVKLLEDSVPVWSPSHGSGLQSRDEVALGLQIKNIIFLESTLFAYIKAPSVIVHPSCC